jgi:hypothetical protein
VALLRALKGLVRMHPTSVALVTLPTGSLPHSFLMRAQQIADVVLETQAVDEDDKELAAMFSDYGEIQGLLHLQKMALLNTQVGLALGHLLFDVHGCLCYFFWFCRLKGRRRRSQTLRRSKGCRTCKEWRGGGLELQQVVSFPLWVTNSCQCWQSDDKEVIKCSDYGAIQVRLHQQKMGLVHTQVGPSFGLFLLLFRFFPHWVACPRVASSEANACADDFQRDLMSLGKGLFEHLAGIVIQTLIRFSRLGLCLYYLLRVF